MTDFPLSVDADRFEALLNAGILASQQGDSEAALAHFANATLAKPDDARPFHLAAAVWAGLGQTAAADDAFREALARAPALHVARFQWGLMQFSAGSPQNAASTWEPLLALPLDDPLHHFVRGLCAIATGELATAVGELEAGMRRNTDNPPLNRDIQRIIEGLRALSAQAETASTVPAQASADTQTTDDDATHFLLGVYRSADSSLH